MLIKISPSWSKAGAPKAAQPPEHPRTKRGNAMPQAHPERVEVRPARVADMKAVEPLIREFANDNLMLPKSSDQLARTFREFVVAVDENQRLLGCGALRIYNEGLAEICSLAVDAPYQGLGIGRRLVEQLVEEARALEIQTVFALTLQPEFFGHLGFEVVAKEEFPLKVWADCRSCPKLHACDEIAVARQV